MVLVDIILAILMIVANHPGKCCNKLLLISSNSSNTIEFDSLNTLTLAYNSFRILLESEMVNLDSILIFLGISFEETLDNYQNVSGYHKRRLFLNRMSYQKYPILVEIKSHLQMKLYHNHQNSQ